MIFSRFRRSTRYFLLLGLAGTTALAQNAPPSETHRKSVELLPDASVAESISRKINVDYGSVRIDGEKSTVSLSSLTADQVLAAEATKVPTPDLDADAVGGLLQLTSRRSFEQLKPTARANVAANFDSLVGRFSPEISTTYGRAFGRESQLGYVVTAGASRDYDRDDELDLDWDSTSGGAWLEEVGFSRDDSVNDEVTASGQLDWKISDRTFAQFRASYAAERGTSRQRTVAYRLDNPRALEISASEIDRSFEDGSDRETHLTLGATITRKSERWEGDLRLSHTRRTDRSPDSRDYEFRQDGVGIDYRLPDVRFPHVSARPGFDADDPALFRLNEFQHNREDRREEDTVMSLDVKLPAIPRLPASWMKAGAKIRALRTDRVYASDVYDAPGGILLSEVADAPAGGFFQERYSLGVFPSTTALRRLFADQPQRFRLDVDDTRNDTDPANYQVRQEVLATYALGSFAVGKRTRVLAGARMERTANRFEGNEVVVGDNGRYEATNPIGAKSNYTNWFPGVHLTHSVSPRLNLFVSWSQSIRRPDYGQLVPARRTDRASREISEGNPELRPTLYVNYDAAVDFEYADSGKLSIEVYHRDIQDTRVSRRTVLASGPFAGYERSRPENGGGASLQGIELNWEQELSAWAGWLRDVGLEVNYTFTRSEQSLENRGGDRVPMADRPQHEITVQLSFERGPFYGSLAFDYASKALVSVGSTAASDNFAPAQRGWDLSLSYELNDRWRSFLEVDNLTAENERWYEGSPGQLEGYSLRSPQFRFGLKWER